MAVVDDLEEAQALADEWRTLLRRSRTDQPTLTPTWLSTWWRVFGSKASRSLAMVVFRNRDGHLVGLAPLLRRVTLRAAVLPFVRLELLGSGEPEPDEIASAYLGLIVEPGHEQAVAQALAGALCAGCLGRWDELQLVGLASDDPTVEQLSRALGSHRCRLEVVSTTACPFIALPASFADYLASLPGTHRYFSRRTLRELERWAGPGGYHLQVATSQPDLDRGMAILRDLHAERWRVEGAKGVFASPRFREFHDRLRTELHHSEDGAVEVLWLEAHGRPVAALYNIHYRDRLYFYQSGRSMSVPAPVRPGIAIHLLAIQRAIAAGLSEYDFWGYETRFKRQLATGRRVRVTLRAVAPGARARVLERTRIAARTLARRLNPTHATGLNGRNGQGRGE